MSLSGKRVRGTGRDASDDVRRLRAANLIQSLERGRQARLRLALAVTRLRQAWNVERLVGVIASLSDALPDLAPSPDAAERFLTRAAVSTQQLLSRTGIGFERALAQCVPEREVAARRRPASRSSLPGDDAPSAALPTAFPGHAPEAVAHDLLGHATSASDDDVAGAERERAGHSRSEAELSQRWRQASNGHGEERPPMSMARTRSRQMSDQMPLPPPRRSADRVEVLEPPPPSGYEEDVMPLHMIDLGDAELMAELHALLARLPHAIYYYLHEHLFPELLQFQEKKLSACGQDLGGDILFPLRLGFSGTPSNLLPQVRSLSPDGHPRLPSPRLPSEISDISIQR